MEYDFANILFAGPCNRFCPFCIGKQVADQHNVNNLNLYPLANWSQFIEKVNKYNIKEIIFTGLTTDPHLYKYEKELIQDLRRSVSNLKISIHTNGVLSLQKIHTFNLYDRATISLPSFDSQIYNLLMGSTHVPNLEKLLAESKIPIKISCVVNEYNVHDIENFLNQLQKLGIKRVAIRQLYGDKRKWPILKGYTPIRYYRKNPVYDIGGLEVTYWNFDETNSNSINLFADGTIHESYLIAK
ncbi:MAG: radical SAM protein [Leptonema sp. (in: Bacteria)]|nr:radical SAM protein [Leptonema sp. (in: bacteria)]